MTNSRRRVRGLRVLGQSLAVACALLPRAASAQGLTGALIGTVKDAQGGVISGAVVRIRSPALIGGPQTTTTDQGELRFPALPPGLYALDIEFPGFRPYHEDDITIGAGATIERPVQLQLGSVENSVVVDGSGPRLDARNPGFGTRFGAEDLAAIPMRRFSPYEWVKTAPGISPTSPAGPNMLVSAFGSGVDQNQFLMDGTNITATGNGVARADPGVDFIQELQIQSVGASVEYGNVQGAVVNVITRSGSNRFQYDAAYYWQPAALTSQPVSREYDSAAQLNSGYERAPTATSRPASAAPSLAIGCGFLRGINNFATPTANRAPIRTFRESTNRTRSSRSSPGAWRRAGSWFKASTMSSGPTLRRRRQSSRATPLSVSTRRCRRSISVT